VVKNVIPKVTDLEKKEAGPKLGRDWKREEKECWKDFPGYHGNGYRSPQGISISVSCGSEMVVAKPCGENSRRGERRGTLVAKKVLHTKGGNFQPYVIPRVGAQATKENVSTKRSTWSVERSGTVSRLAGRLVGKNAVALIGLLKEGKMEE